jgi:hypothetical protein
MKQARRAALAVFAGGVLLLWIAACAQAAVYVYVDDQGTAHFTDAPTKACFQRLPGFGLPPGVDLARGQYADLVNEIAGEYVVDPALVKAVIRAESNFDELAVSRKGARGLMQLMPGPAVRYEVADAFNPAENIRGGVRHLKALQELFPGRLGLVLAAYNAGENAVLRHNGIPPYPETREYVARVLGYYGRGGRVPSTSASPAVGRQTKDGTAERIASTPSVFRQRTADGTLMYTNIPR